MKTINKSYSLVRIAAALILLFSTSGMQNVYAQAAKQTRPNIIFIMSDDHALQAIGAYGSTINKTPNIDRIAKEGMRFNNAMVTNSICGPSRAVILTGKYSHLNGMATNQQGVVFNGAQTTFPKLLQRAGYQTAIIGKWHLTSHPTGFNYWSVLAGQGQYYNPDFLTASGRQRKPGYVTDIITDDAIRWLDSARDKSSPFMLMLHHKAPHRNWLPSQEYATLYDDVKIPEPATLFDDYAGRASGSKNQEMEIGRHMELLSDNKVIRDSSKLPEGYVRMNAKQRKALMDTYREENKAFLDNPPKGDGLVRWKYQRYIKDYLRTVASVDDNVGKVLAYLDKNGLMENTIIVYASDQGFYLGEHGWFDKRWMYEQSLHMPLLVRWPGVVKAGTTNNNIVLNLDIAETFLEAAGIKPPDEMQGKSLVPLLKAKAPEWRKQMYYHYTEFPKPHHVPPHFGIRTEQYKLIYYYTLNEWELFDLKKDPQEMKSVYDDVTYAKTVQALKLQLAKLQKEYKDPVADKVKY
jgi:arylsulfatase A-like enzyme